MASKNEDNWLANYEALKAHVIETGHFFNKHNKLCNWAKYQRKRIKAGTLTEKQRLMFEALEKMRGGEHTGGRKKNHTTGSGTDTPTQDRVIAGFVNARHCFMGILPSLPQKSLKMMKF